MHLGVTAIRDGADLLPGRIRAEINDDAHPAVVLYDVMVLIGPRGKPALQLADQVLVAVTAWHAEIHRRGHGDPLVRPGAPR